MYSERTTYTLCKTPADYKLCHDFFKAENSHPLRLKEGLEDREYVFEKIKAPTISAIRDGKVVGVIATKTWKGCDEHIANPCHVSYDLKNHVPVLIRLIDAYETELRKLKIPHYKILMPSYKPSARRIFEQYKKSILFNRSEDKRLNIYIVPVVS